MNEFTPEDKAKWNKILADYDPKTASAMYAVRSVVEHFVETEKLIEADAENEVEKLSASLLRPSNDEDIPEYLFERDQARTLHDETLIPMHRYSCLVMLYIAVERELRRLIDNLQAVKQQKLKVKDLKGSYLDQIRKFLDVFYGLDISQCPSYLALDDLRRVRNCIVHSQGELSLCDEREQHFLCNLKTKYNDLFAHPASDIDVGPKSIKLFFTQTLEFFIWVFQQLQKLQPVEEKNWIIHPSAERERLERVLGKTP